MAIYHKPDHAFFCVLTGKTKCPSLYLCLDPLHFVFPLSSFPRIEHLIITCGHQHHRMCHPCSILDVDLTYLIHNPRVKISPLGCLNYLKPNTRLSMLHQWLLRGHIWHLGQSPRRGLTGVSVVACEILLHWGAACKLLLPIYSAQKHEVRCLSTSHSFANSHRLSPLYSPPNLFTT